jgi:nitroreductase
MIHDNRFREINMLTTKEAIAKRRSIRKFKSDKIAHDILEELIDAARLAPSNGNTQPWRFKIVVDQDIKNKLSEAAYGQKFVAKAPAIIVCCTHLEKYADDVAAGAKYLANIQAIDYEFVDNTIIPYVEFLHTLSPTQLRIIASLNVAIAIEHIMLRALDYGLGTCWVTANNEKVCELFNWDENTYVVALLPIGYPAENPTPRKRHCLAEIII